MWKKELAVQLLYVNRAHPPGLMYVVEVLHHGHVVLAGNRMYGLSVCSCFNKGTEELLNMVRALYLSLGV